MPIRRSGALATPLAIVVTAMIAFAGCGDSDDGGQSSQSASGDSNLPESALIDSVQSSGKLKVGVAVALPWLGQNPETKEYVGPAVLIAEKAAERLGVEIEYVPQTFDSMVAALLSKKIDIADAALYATEERKKVLEMVPWSVGGFCYLTQKDSSLNSTDQFNSPDVTMANFIGVGTYEATKEGYPEAEQITRSPTAGDAANIPEVRSGEADVTPFDAALAKLYEKRYPDLKVIPSDCFENPDLPTPVAVAMNKGDEGFKEFMTTTIEGIQPELDKAFAKFGEPKYAELGQ